MPDPQRTQGELQTLLSRPQYSPILYRRNEFRDPTKKAETIVDISTATAKYLHECNPLMNPVEVLELRGPLQLYRAHDGGESTRRGLAGKYNISAGTLGGSWSERSVAETIWKATARFEEERRQWFMNFLRSSNFVLPEWNAMRYMVCMVVPAGHAVVVARGRGNWKAMRTPPGKNRPGGPANNIHTAADVHKVGMMALPGLPQCVVPLYDDMWVYPVAPNAKTWPFLT
jgi:hypothetical protein